jgi:predicted ATPase
MALAGVGGGGVRILHWLEISNFKSYRSSGRIPLEHPSVLIGPNNCGKPITKQQIPPLKPSYGEPKLRPKS